MWAGSVTGAGVAPSIATGVPVNVTLLFSADHYRAAADAYIRDVERRIVSGQDPAVGSVASVFMSRWHVAMMDKVPGALRDRLALAVGFQVYRAYREVMASDRWQRLENQGGRTQRLCGQARAPRTRRFPTRCMSMSSVHRSRCQSRRCWPSLITAMRARRGGPTGATAQPTLREFQGAGVDVAALVGTLWSSAAESFVKAWNDLMAHIDQQTASLGA